MRAFESSASKDRKGLKGLTSPPCVCFAFQNLVVKKEGSLDRLTAIAWGGSGDDRARARPEHRDGWLSVESQVRGGPVPRQGRS